MANGQYVKNGKAQQYDPVSSDQMTHSTSTPNTRGPKSEPRVLPFPTRQSEAAPTVEGPLSQEQIVERVAALTLRCRGLAQAEPAGCAHVESVINGFPGGQTEEASTPKPTATELKNIGKPVVDLTGDDREGA